jgi:hypothetical protein
MAEQPQTGDDCPQCGDGKLRVYAGRDGKSVRVQYRRCDQCRATDKLNVPLQYVSRRKKKRNPCT